MLIDVDAHMDMHALQTVIVFLVLISSGIQYLVQKMNYNRDLKRIEWIIGQARQAAWGTKLTPVQGQRKVRNKVRRMASRATCRVMGRGLTILDRSR